MPTNTIPDIVVVKDAWTELYTATGLSSGTTVVVQNKGSSGLIVATNTSNTTPLISSTDGWVVAPNDTIKITAESYIFLRSSGFSNSVHVEAA